jgi:hypothetical protein
LPEHEQIDESGPPPAWFDGFIAYARSIMPICLNCHEERVDVLRHRCSNPYTLAAGDEGEEGGE